MRSAPPSRREWAMLGGAILLAGAIVAIIHFSLERFAPEEKVKWFYIATQDGQPLAMSLSFDTNSECYAALSTFFSKRPAFMSQDGSHTPEAIGFCVGTPKFLHRNRDEK